MSRSGASPNTRAELNRIVAWSLLRAARRTSVALATALAPFDLSPVQFGLLAQLSVEPGLPTSELARRIEVRPQSATTQVELLSERGLVERVHGGGSGRRNPVRLTTAGSAVLRRAWPAAIRVSGPDALPLTGQEISTLLSLLARLLGP